MKLERGPFNLRGSGRICLQRLFKDLPTLLIRLGLSTGAKQKRDRLDQNWQLELRGFESEI